jgi:hypothetical protein
MEAKIEAKAAASAGTSAWVALLPLGFIAVGIGAIAFAASLAVRARPAPVVSLPAPAVAEPISPREEARLAAQITAFALAKVAPERFEADVRDVSQPSEAPRAKLAHRKTADKPAVKVATVLPPPRPAMIAASADVLPPRRPVTAVASAAPQPPSLIPVGFVPAADVEPKPGVLAQMANYVPSPRRILSDAVSDAWSLGGKVGKLIPKI